MADYVDGKKLRYENADTIGNLVEIIPRDFVQQDVDNPSLKRIALFYETAKNIMEAERYASLCQKLSEIVEIESRTQMELNQRAGEGQSQIWPFDKAQEELNGEFFIEQYADYLKTATALMILTENRCLLSNEVMDEISDDVKNEFDVDDDKLIPPSFYDGLADQYTALLLEDARKMSDFCGVDPRGAVEMNKEAILKALIIRDNPFPTWSLS